MAESSLSLQLPSVRNPPEDDSLLSLVTDEVLPPGETPGGYHVSILLQGLLTRFICGLCKLILRNPVMSPCGHRLCRGCLASVPPETLCETCTEEGDNFTLSPTPLIPDSAIRRELYREEARCDTPGCQWTGTFKEYLFHQGKCERKLIKCACGVELPRMDQSRHLTSGCERRLVACSYCSVQITAGEVRGHQVTCPRYPVTCPDMCGERVERREMETHRRESCCNRPCEFGCQGQRGAEHQREAVVVHLDILLARVCERGATVAEEREGERREGERGATVAEGREGERGSTVAEGREGERGATVAEGRDEEMGEREGRQGINQRIADVSRKVEELKRKLDDVIAERTSTGGERDGDSPVRSSITEQDSTNLVAALKEKQEMTEGIAAVLNREIENLIKTQTQLERQRSSNAEQIEGATRRAAAIERSLTLKDLALAEQDIRIQELEATSFDGTLLWKIDDFSRRRHDAVSGRTTNHYSPCFYTTRAGYKMRLRIYLNGDGMGRGTHISLFFVILRGQYDAILPWPFKQKVTLTLMDQNRKEHVVDAFRPDPSSASFRRPQSSMNLASGIPLFCPLSRLEDRRFAYVRDDVMYVKIAVNTDGLT